jgi:hypothetical protein
MMAPNRRILRFMLALVVVAYGLTAVQEVLERLGAATRPSTPDGSPAEMLADLPGAEEANVDS